MEKDKYRAWDKESKLMIYTDENDTSNYWDGCVGSSIEMVNSILKDDRYIWLKYINKKDKNGVEIYNGDIIKIDGDKLYIGEIREVPLGYLVDYGKDGTKTHLPDYVEVIGNKFYNPELIPKLYPKKYTEIKKTFIPMGPE